MEGVRSLEMEINEKELGSRNLGRGENEDKPWAVTRRTAARDRVDPPPRQTSPAAQEPTVNLSRLLGRRPVPGEAGRGGGGVRRALAVTRIPLISINPISGSRRPAATPTPGGSRVGTALPALAARAARKGTAAPPTARSSGEKPFYSRYFAGTSEPPGGWGSTDAGD